MTERERELQMARREGFVAGAWWATMNVSDSARSSRRQEEAAIRYPITVTQPRVVRSESGAEFRVVDGVLQQKYHSDKDWFSWNVSSGAIRDLLANPTEEVAE